MKATRNMSVAFIVEKLTEKLTSNEPRQKRPDGCVEHLFRLERRFGRSIKQPKQLRRMTPRAKSKSWAANENAEDDHGDTNFKIRTSHIEYLLPWRTLV